MRRSGAVIVAGRAWLTMAHCVSLWPTVHGHMTDRPVIMVGADAGDVSTGESPICPCGAALAGVCRACVGGLGG